MEQSNMKKTVVVSFHTKLQGGQDHEQVLSGVI